MGHVFWEVEEYEDEKIDDRFIVYFSQGVAFYAHDNSKVYNSLSVSKKISPFRKGIFIVDQDQNIRISNMRGLHHSDFLNGMPVLCAGEILFSKSGKVKTVSNKSGHYMPDGSCLVNVLEDLIREDGWGGEIIFKITRK